MKSAASDKLTEREPRPDPEQGQSSNRDGSAERNALEILIELSASTRLADTILTPALRPVIAAAALETIPAAPTLTLFTALSMSLKDTLCAYSILNEYEQRDTSHCIVLHQY